MSACPLLTNIHTDLNFTKNNSNVLENTYLLTGNYEYYHYNCDGFHDRGWGCGYRTLQTICSWLNHNTHKSHPVPNIREIQKILVEVGDKSDDFVGSRQWIGSFEVCLVIDQQYNIPCKILHIAKGELINNLDKIKEHFIKFGSPIMMGGDLDCSSKGIIGVYDDGPESQLLVVDPHFVGKHVSKEFLQKKGWVKWQPLEEFIDSSFYNLCLPQVKSINMV